MKTGCFSYTQISELSTLTGAFFIHKLAIRDFLDKDIYFHCHKKCSARSDAMNIIEIHRPANFNYLAKYQTIAKIRTNSQSMSNGIVFYVAL